VPQALPGRLRTPQKSYSRQGTSIHLHWPRRLLDTSGAAQMGWRLTVAADASQPTAAWPESTIWSKQRDEATELTAAPLQRSGLGGVSDGQFPLRL